MREYIRAQLVKAVHNYDEDSQSRSLMDFIQANVRLCRVNIIFTSAEEVIFS